MSCCPCYLIRSFPKEKGLENSEVFCLSTVEAGLEEREEERWVRLDEGAHAGRGAGTNMNRRTFLYTAAGAAVTAVATGCISTTPKYVAAGKRYLDYAVLDQRRAGQVVRAQSGNLWSQWMTSPQPSGEYWIYWGEPTAWPPTYREVFIEQDGWIVITGWYLSDGRFTEIRPVSFRVVRGPVKPPQLSLGEPYAAATVPSGEYELEFRGDLYTTRVDDKSKYKVYSFLHRQVWSPPVLVENPKWTEGNTKVPCIRQRECWDDTSGPDVEGPWRDVYFANSIGPAWKIVANAGKDVGFLKAGWAWEPTESPPAPVGPSTVN